MSERELQREYLRQIQADYFDGLDAFFGHPYREMKKHAGTPEDIATDMASTKSVVEAVLSEAQQFTSAIVSAWRPCIGHICAAVRGLDCLKSVYGGRVFPTEVANIACCAGLYVDTIVLPDPVLRSCAFFRTPEPSRAVFEIISHALHAMQYKELALADVDPPIVLILPDLSMLDEGVMRQLSTAGEADTLWHSSRVFGRPFRTIAELRSFLRPLRKATQIVQAAVGPAGLRVGESHRDSIEQHLESDAERLQGVLQEDAELALPSKILLQLWLGRMMQVNDTLVESSLYGAAPLVDAEVSWQYLLWKYRYDAERSGNAPRNLKESVITRVLSTGGLQGTSLLANVPPKALLNSF